jgi:hypothetical protein
MPELEAGDKVVLPPSLLEQLLRTSASLQTMVEPMLFKLTRPTVDVGTGTRNGGVRDSKHVGVLEFNAPEGVAVVPTWIANSLGLTPDEGQKVCVERKMLPKGTFAKLQPLTTAFAERIEHPKEALEEFLSSHFATLSKGDTIQLDTGVEIFELQVLETKPSSDGVLIIDTDLEVDFAPAAIGGEAMAMGMTAGQAVSPAAQQAAEAAADADRRAAARAARAAKAAAANGVPLPPVAAAAPVVAAPSSTPAATGAPQSAQNGVPESATMAELTNSRAAVESLLTGHQNRTVAALGSAATTASVVEDDPDLQRAIAESMATAAAQPPPDVDEDEQLAAAIAASLASGPRPPPSKDLLTSSVAARVVEEIDEAVALESSNPMTMMEDSDDEHGTLNSAVGLLASRADGMSMPKEKGSAGLPELLPAGSSVQQDCDAVPEVAGLQPAAPSQAEPSPEELRKLRMARFG